MQCSNVQKSLLVPGGSDSLNPKLAAHLRICADCQKFLRDRDRFHHLWIQTRPQQIPDFGPIWSHVAAQVAAEPAPSAFPRWPRAAVRLAQAAAVLLAVLLGARLWPTPSKPPAHPTTTSQARPMTPAEGLKPIYTFDEGQSLILRIDSGQVTEIVREQVACSDTVQIAVEHDVFNYMESL